MTASHLKGVKAGIEAAAKLLDEIAAKEDPNAYGDDFLSAEILAEWVRALSPTQIADEVKK